MATILRSVGQGNFRVVGPLTLTNRVKNPSFKAPDLDNGTTGPNNWTAIGSAVLNYDDAPVGQTAKGMKVQPINSSGATVTRHGYMQTGIEVDQEVSYYYRQELTYSTSILPINCQIDYYGFDGSLVASEPSVLVQGGSPSGTNVPLSVKFLVPSGVQTIGVSTYIEKPLASGGSLPAWWAFKTMVSDLEDTYIDGDFAGYVWSDTRFTSTTLKSTLPGDLRVFHPLANIPVID